MDLIKAVRRLFFSLMSLWCLAVFIWCGYHGRKVDCALWGVFALMCAPPPKRCKCEDS